MEAVSYSIDIYSLFVISPFRRMLRVSTTRYVCILVRYVFSRVHVTLQPALSVRQSYFPFFYDFVSLT